MEPRRSSPELGSIPPRSISAMRPLPMKFGTLYQSQRHILSSPPPPPERPKLGTKATVVAALLAVAVAVCVVSAVAVPIARRMRRAAQLVGLCDTTACTSYARMVAQSTSGSVNPCHNFYRFVCEGYANSSRSVFRDHVDTFTSLVSRSLRTAVAPGSAQSAFEKAAVFYQSCVAVVAEGTNQFDQFRGIMEDAGIMWPRVAQTPELMASMLKMAITLNLFTIVFFAADSDVGKCRIEIWKGDILEYMKRRRRELEAVGKYEMYYESFSRIFGVDDESAISTNSKSGDAPVPSRNASLNFEQFLQTENVVFHYLTGRKQSVKAVFDNIAKLHRVSPSISAWRWADVFRQMMGMPSAQMHNASSLILPCSQEITVWDLQYLRSLDDALLAVGWHQLHFYYGWTVVQVLARFMSYGLSVMSHGSVKAARDESPLHCLRLTESTMGLVVYQRYAATDFNRDTRLELHEMVNVVYAALLRMLQANPDLDVRETSIDLRLLESTLLPKFEIIENQVKLDRLFADVPAMAKDSFAQNWQQVQQALRRMSPAVRQATRSFYLSATATASGYSIHRASDRRELGLAPYVSLLPLYDLQVADSVKYGGLGFMIAEATFQFFQEHLPEQSRFRALLEQRTRCYENSGALRGLKADPTKHAAFERAVALSFLWQAFRSPLRRRDPRWRLHGLGSFSEEQLFFVASCFPLCAGHQSVAAEMECNEPLRHNRYFPGAFRCPGGAPMNPRLKCSAFY
ncbi:endothelin-converting enzyme 1-like [Dermacentor andersoni]|uniref:endothelin-converting enzyme 1-like n=1 Tax=Dermacentor andersoni TaxID=34620 RepID=UPI003B3B5ED4